MNLPFTSAPLLSTKNVQVVESGKVFESSDVCDVKT